MIRNYSKPTVVSLFSGCGGLDIGFRQENFDLIYACDNDPAAVEVYKRNIDRKCYVRDVTSDEFHSDIDKTGYCDVVLGGFPCQGFSKAGPKREEDSRNLLYLEMKSAIQKLQPLIFIAENVDGLSQNFKGKFLEQIVRDFENIGYKVIFRILDSANYGVPQHRRRIFFVGIKDRSLLNDFEFPMQTHRSLDRNGESKISRTPDLIDNVEFDYQRNAVTIREAIFDIRDLSIDLPDHRVTNKWSDDYSAIMNRIGEGQKLCNVRFSDTSVYTWDIPEVFGDVNEDEIGILEIIGKNRRHKKYGNIPNGNPLNEETIRQLSNLEGVKERLHNLVNMGYLKEKNDGYDLKGAIFCSGLFKRSIWDAPSPTVLTNFGNPRYFVHPQRNTPFSLRECARLQGFPDDFVFTVTDCVKELEDGYRLVGNAVSPPLGRLFAKSVLKSIGDYHEINDEVTLSEKEFRATTT